MTNADAGKPEIILVEAMMPQVESALDAAYVVHRAFKEDDKDAFLARVGANVRAVVTGGGSGMKASWFDALPKLGLIAINGVGTDAVDLVQAKARGVRVTTTPGVLTDDVADIGMGLILSTLRKLAQGDRFVRAGQWGKRPFPLGSKVTGKKLGIFGMGQIGGAIAKRAAGFDMPVAYSNRKPVEGSSHQFFASLTELAAWSDILVIAASASPATRGVVNAEVMDALGPQGVLVNVGRGAIIDEPELMKALATGRIAGAGLDVFTNEPNVPAELFPLDNVVLLPHQASATLETRLAMGDLVVRNVQAFFAGEEVLTPVV
ncbi:2-hydroxyacid dehydrogenase [Pigmentiphaga aceris]|uniref:2-hydroxyacid dehydrogenase n=2 Tax=Pigmentiphaga aceris TaxID=1940612 RepID=A0A5C0B552_9BURK|nr:2-hydroxyacid dehydrogenase [Pigmentiphaga aceris]